MTTLVDRLGARWLGDGRTVFTVWAPNVAHVDVVLASDVLAMEPGARGYHRVVADDVRPGDTYWFRLHREDGSEAALRPVRGLRAEPRPGGQSDAR